MIMLKWSRFAFPWFWKPRVSHRLPDRGWALRWGYLYVLIGDEED